MASRPNYTITNSDESLSITIPEGVVDDTSLSLSLIGRYVSNYGTYFAKNTLRHLENFASATSPDYPITGQLWYDKTNELLKVYTGSVWSSISTEGFDLGDLSTAVAGNVLTYDGNVWVPGAGSVGYTGSAGAGFTGSASTTAGYTGSVGALGYTGSSGGGGGGDGYTGSVGYTGSSGLTGYTGSFGLTGYTGSFGITGYTGSQGTTGYTGSSGLTGYTGSFGTTGYTGSAGPSTDINAANDTTTNASFYPVMVDAAGSVQAATVSTSKFYFNPSTGNLSVSGDITAFASDYRLKENIQIIDHALEKLDQIRGVTYNWNSTAMSYGFFGNMESSHVGVIAQDLEQVLPEVVKPAPFDQGIDEHGQEFSRSGEHYKTVQYDKIVALLIQAVKELKAEVDVLKQHIK